MSGIEDTRVCQCADCHLQEFVENLPVETSHHRMKTQAKKCPQGTGGTCCKLCSNGPCRITPNSPKGVCGADADVIVSRNLLRAVAAGTSCYLHVFENAAMRLKKTAEKRGTIKGTKTLDDACKALDIKAYGTHQKALALAEMLLQDISRPYGEKMELATKMVISKRAKVWEELDILPGGAKAEILDALVKTSTNSNSDALDMLQHSLTLGIATGLYGLKATNIVNDILLGEPELYFGACGLETIDPDYVNILITGHQGAMIAPLVEKAAAKESIALAENRGAKGIHIVGSTCVGQEMELHGAKCGGVFSGQAGNNFTTEAMLATGAIDCVVSEFNCTLPGIDTICTEYGIRQITLDDVAKTKSGELTPMTFETQRETAEQVIAEALVAYEKRRGSVTLRQPKSHEYTPGLAGVSEATLKRFLGGNWKLLKDLIVSGAIKGIVGVVGCSNLINGHDVLTVELTKELIKRDILVLTAGCAAGGLANSGLTAKEAAEMAGPNLRFVCEKLEIPPVLNFGPCLAIGRMETVVSEMAEELGVDISQLPVALSAPQWLEEQALADGVFGVALGLNVHLGTAPAVTGSDSVVKLLTEEMENLTGGKFLIDGDATSSADLLETVIMEKRGNLGI